MERQIPCVDTVNHSGRHFFIFLQNQCPCRLSLRSDILKSFGGPTLCDGDWSVDDVLKFSYMPAVEEAYNAFMYHYGSEDEDEDT